MLTEKSKEERWRRFKEVVEALGYGYLERVEISEGVPVHVDLCCSKIDLAQESVPSRRVKAIRSIDNR